jgi:hypothetical protein
MAADPAADVGFYHSETFSTGRMAISPSKSGGYTL